MTAPWLDDGDVQLYHGGALDLLRTLPAESVQTCVTSPPYWGLRDYGTGSWTGGDDACDHMQPPIPHTGLVAAATRSDGHARNESGTRAAKAAQPFRDACARCGARRVDAQLGLEATPTAYVAALVAVFAEVWRVLRADGTLWLNLGDSYANNGAGNTRGPGAGGGAARGEQIFGGAIGGRDLPPGLKAKDLVGIPWRVAFALQQPRYIGTIANELDRVWLAAMIDAEGCMYVHKRKAGQPNGQGYDRKSDTYGSGMEIANCHESIIQRCVEITGRGSVSRQDAGRKQPLYRWNLRTNECREVIREVYPYLVGKQQQARIAIGCPSSGERAEAAHAALMLLHNGGLTDVDFPAPESCYMPGWYLRSDIVWSKSNPMPESVTDRPTKAHEYVFLLAKQPRYYYDADAIREPHTRLWDPATNGGNLSPDGLHKANGSYRERGGDYPLPNPAGRNARSVWTVATQPTPEAHFATFPEALVRRCILAGSREGDCVLDPFVGSGTTAVVARKHGRRAIGIDLSADYLAIAARRLGQQSLFAQEPEPAVPLVAHRGLAGGAYSPPGQSPHSNARDVGGVA